MAKPAASGSKRNVAVIGGGLAGLACALAAARAGASVQLFALRVAGDPAVHVDVVPNMLRGLVQLGVGDACVRAGFPYRRTSAIGQRGTPLYSLDAARLAGPRYPGALGITSAQLHAVLKAAGAEAGVVMRLGEPVVDVDVEGPRLRFARGEPLRVDLAVLACGARGGLRERFFGADALPAEAEWSCGLAGRPLALDDALQATTAAGDRAHVVPVSGSLAGVRVASRQAIGALDAQALRALLARFPAPIAALAAHVEEGAPVVRQQLASGLLPQPWARGAVLAVGDCAHALPAVFGQAGAQAIEDAVVLGELLRQEGTPAAIAQRLVARRFPRVQQVAAIAMQAARWQAAPEGDTDLLQLARSLDAVVHEPA
ncbi:FAD-dependent oxidoreductase [Ramlibacter sp. XY19]|uniref:FAD-dependent oxidoreductase n=1 Tax=Ramlibacter paludis TaxID=2908000 RepID=UPI0023D9EE9D|nr:FAD-dependent oxidoreductase [Ramlibacter paludis]